MCADSAGIAIKEKSVSILKALQNKDIPYDDIFLLSPGSGESCFQKEIVKDI